MRQTFLRVVYARELSKGKMQKTHRSYRKQSHQYDSIICLEILKQFGDDKKDRLNWLKDLQLR